MTTSRDDSATTPPSPAIDDSIPPKKNRKTYGLLALLALVAGWVPVLLDQLYNLLCQDGWINRFESSWFDILFLVLASLFPVLITIAAILGFYAWRTIPGKIAAIGGLISYVWFVSPKLW